MPEKKTADINDGIAEKVTSAFNKIEDAAVGAYKKIEDKFVDAFLAKSGETTEDAKKRVRSFNKN